MSDVTRRFRELITRGLTLEEAARACQITVDDAKRIWNSATIKNGRVGEMSTELDQIVEYYNERFFVIGDMGGKCRVCSHEDDPAMPGRRVLVAQTFGDFRNRFDNIDVQVGTNAKGEPIMKPQGSAWLDHYARRQFDKITFSPGQKLGPKVYNLWKGFAFEPKEGDCSLYLAHIRDVICSGDDFLYGWVLNWMAYAIQHPNEPGHTAIVLQGEKGTGKNTFADKFGKLWGNHYFAINNPVHLAGRFNSHLRECSVLFGNEAFYAGNHEHENVLKGLITDELLPIEAKFQDLITVRNVLHIILASNSDWIVRTTLDERRFCVLNVSDAHREDKMYFEKINKQMDSGGYEALLHLLLHHELKRFDPRSAPKTAAMADQTARSLHGAEAAWYECLCLGELPAYSDGKNHLYLRSSDLNAWWQARDRKNRSLTDKEVGTLLGEKGMAFEHRRPYLKFGDGNDQAKHWAWFIPSLAECRKRWMAARDAYTERWNLKDDEDWLLVSARDELRTAR